MVEVKMELKRRHLLTGLRRRFFLALPESWAEVPDRMRRRWWQWAFTMPIEAARVKAVASLLKRLPWYVRRRVPAEDRAAMVGLLSWMDTQPDCESLALPSCTVSSTSFHLPSPKGENMSCIEFALGDDLYKEYGDNQQSSTLHMLTWLLYREADTDQVAADARGDIRVPLRSRSEIERRLQRYGVPPAEMQVQAILFFGGLKQFLHGTFGQWIFQIPDEDEEDPVAPPQNTSPNFGWWGVFQSVAEGGVFGDLEKVYQSSLYEVCVYLVRKRAEQIQLEQAQQRATTPLRDHDDLY